MEALAVRLARELQAMIGDAPEFDEVCIKVEVAKDIVDELTRMHERITKITDIVSPNG